MTGILHDLGVQGVHVEELWGLDSDLLRDLEYVSFLPSGLRRPRLTPTLQTRLRPRLSLQMGRERRPCNHGWHLCRTHQTPLLCVRPPLALCRVARLNPFAPDSHQVINNACASIALLNATLNIQDPEVRLGDELANLKAFSEGESRLATPLHPGASG